MAEEFNPYYEWLGIPLKDQPPHAYRLLALELFEANPSVIESAAEQRMLLLRSRQAGKHSVLSQQLLNEVAAAQRSLLDPIKRAALDAELKAKLQAAKPKVGIVMPVTPAATALPPSSVLEKPSLAPAAILPPRAQPDVFNSAVSEQARVTPLIRTHVAGKQTPPTVLLVTAGMLVVFVIVLAVAVLNSPSTSTATLPKNPPPNRELPPTEPKQVPMPALKPATVPTPPPTIVPMPIDKKEEFPDPPPAVTKPAIPELPAPPMKVSATGLQVVSHVWRSTDPEKTQWYGENDKCFAAIGSVAGNFLGGGEWFNLAADDTLLRFKGSGVKGIAITSLEIKTPFRQRFEREVVNRQDRQVEPVKLIHKNDGFAVLAGFAGPFQTIKDLAKIRLADDGYWYLEGTRGFANVYKYNEPGKFAAEIKEHTWNEGQPEQKLLQRDEGICLMTRICGSFRGGDERVFCELRDDGYWYLGGATSTKRKGWTSVSAIAIRFLSQEGLP